MDVTEALSHILALILSGDDSTYSTILSVRDSLSVDCTTLQHFYSIVGALGDSTSPTILSPRSALPKCKRFKSLFRSASITMNEGSPEKASTNSQRILSKISSSLFFLFTRNKLRTGTPYACKSVTLLLTPETYFRYCATYF